MTTVNSVCARKPYETIYPYFSSFHFFARYVRQLLGIVAESTPPQYLWLMCITFHADELFEQEKGIERLRHPNL